MSEEALSSKAVLGYLPLKPHKSRTSVLFFFAGSAQTPSGHWGKAHIGLSMGNMASSQTFLGVARAGDHTTGLA